MELDFKNKELELKRAVSSREDELQIRGRELEREGERQKDLQSAIDSKQKELGREQRLLGMPSTRRKRFGGCIV